MQSGMPPPGFQDRRGKTILDRAQGCLPAGSQCSEIFLLAALGDAGAEILRDGGSIPPTSTRTWASGPMFRAALMSRSDPKRPISSHWRPEEMGYKGRNSPPDVAKDQEMWA